MGDGWAMIEATRLFLNGFLCRAIYGTVAIYGTLLYIACVITKVVGITETDQDRTKEVEHFVNSFTTVDSKYQ